MFAGIPRRFLLRHSQSWWCSAVQSVPIPFAAWCIAFASLATGASAAPEPPQASTSTAAVVSSEQTPSVANLKRLSLEELLRVQVATVTTASKKPEKATDAPATVIVITANDIRLRGYSTLKDVLRDLPGMETTEYFFSEFGTQVSVRGISGNNKIIVLVNGMRVNPPGGENFPLRSDFSVRDAERIEVIYGPGSTLYGQDAISAVINVITRKPTEGSGGELGVDAGLHAEREGWGSFGGFLDENGNVRFSGYAQYHDSDLTRLDKEYPSWWQYYKDLAQPRDFGTIPSRQDFGLNAFGRLDFFDSSVQAWYRDSRRSSSEGGYPPAYVEEAVWEDRSVVVEGKNTLSLADAVKLDSVATYSRYEIDPSSRYVFNTPDLTNQWFLDDFKYGIGQGGTVEETVRADINGRLCLLGGVMAGAFDIIPKSTVPGGADPDGNVVAQAGAWEYAMPGDPTELYSVPRVVETRYQTYASYAEFGWRIVDRLKLIGGTRVTKDTRFDDIPVTPRAALIYEVMDHLTAKYIFTRAYVAPAPYFANATYDNGTLLATSNPDLKPETSETHEINLAYTRHNLDLGLSAYHGTQHDIITVSDTAAAENIIAQTVYLDGDPAQPRTLVQSANGGDSTSYGIDFYGRFTVGPVSSWFSYSYADFRKTEGGVNTDLTGISRHNGRLGATWAVLPKLFVTPSLVIRSTPDGVDPGTLGDELNTPYEVDLYVLYQTARNIDVFANVRNLTNHKYALAGIDGEAVPQEPFSGVVGMRVTF